MPFGPYIAPQSSSYADLGTNNIQSLARLMGPWFQSDPGWLNQVNPLLTALKAHGNVQLRDTPSGQRPRYNPLNNTISLSSFLQIPGELGHQEQVTERGVIPASILNFLQLLAYGDKGRYSTPGTLEYNAHNVKAPNILNMFHLRGL